MSFILNMTIFNTSKQWRQTIVTLLVNLLSVHIGVIFSWSITNYHEPMTALAEMFLDGLEDVFSGGLDHEQEPYAHNFLKRLPFLCILAVLPLAAFIAERFGRKKALALSAIPFALYSIMIAAGNDFLFVTGMMICGGLACALQFYLVPMYVCEISSESRRGAHGVIRPSLMAIGTCVGYMVSYVWMTPVNAIVSLILSAVFLVLLVVLPESPAWLARKNRTSEANRVLDWLGIDESSSVSKNEVVNEEVGNIEPNNLEPIAFMKMFKLPEVRKGFAVSVGLLVGQAIIQINSIGAFYITSCGLGLIMSPMDFYYNGYMIITMDLTWPLVINIAILIVVCIAASLLIDRIGRIPLLVISCICMTIALVIMCTAIGVGSYQFSIVNITIAIIYIICYFLGMGSVPSIIAVEIIPNSVVSYVYAMSMGVYWIVVWIVVEIFMAFVWDFYFHVPYFCFGQAIICALLFVFVVAFVPETKKSSSLSPVNVSCH